MVQTLIPLIINTIRKCNSYGRKYVIIQWRNITQLFPQPLSHTNTSIIWHLAGHNIYVLATQTITCTQTRICINIQSIQRRQTFAPNSLLCSLSRLHSVERQTDWFRAMWLPLLTTSNVAYDHLNVHVCLIEYRFTMQTCHLHLKHDKTDGQTESDMW